MKKGYLILNSLLIAIIGWLLPSCKTHKKTVKTEETKVEEQEQKPESQEVEDEPVVVKPDTTHFNRREIRVLYGPPSSFRNR